LHAFHYTRVQHLQLKDYPQRKTYCEHFLRETDRDPRFPCRVIFSDESLFAREGVFNSHNMHLWSDENCMAQYVGPQEPQISIFWISFFGDIARN